MCARPKLPLAPPLGAPPGGAREAGDGGRDAGPAPLAPPPLRAALDAFDQPAFLLVRGQVVFANAAARERAGEPPWLSEQPPPDLGHAAPLPLGEVTATLVVERRLRPPACEACALPRSPRFARLPPSLSNVARLLGAGLSDKDICRDTGLELPTVRTYVRRVFTRLGVHSRRELIALERRGEGEPPR